MISREQTTDWRFTNAQIAHVGVAAIDHVLSADRSAKVVFDNVDVALLLVGLAGDAVERTGTALQLGCDGRQLVVGPRMSAVALDLCERSRCMTLSIAQATLASETAPEPAGRININPDIWPEILELAARTYVPASDASRLRGAGAGLTDND